jgi:hypothetical protein
MHAVARADVTMLDAIATSFFFAGLLQVGLGRLRQWQRGRGWLRQVGSGSAGGLGGTGGPGR